MRDRYKSDRALLIIDMLKDFIDPDGALYIGQKGQQIVDKIGELRKAYRRRGDLVIFLCDRHRPDDAEFEVFPPHCVDGTPGAEVVDKLSPEEDDIIIPKRRYSGFFGTELDLTLREYGINTVDIVGVCTNICVLYTAADARNMNYEVIIHGDAVTSMDDNAHEWALKQMQSVLGCQLV